MGFVLLGPPGVGKGTQAVRLSSRLGIPHISTGEMFREAKASGTPMGREAARYMDDGVLVPDDVVIGLVRERLDREDARRGFLLDGFPRTVPQADALAEVTPLAGVVALDAPEDELVRRLTGRRTCRTCQAPFQASELPAGGRCPRDGGELYQRDDDREETIRRRLDEYRQRTAPLVDYYRRRGQLREIDGTGTPDTVASRLAGAIGHEQALGA